MSQGYPRVTVFDAVNDVLLIELADPEPKPVGLNPLLPRLVPENVRPEVLNRWVQSTLRPVLMARWIESGLLAPLLIVDYSGKEGISHDDLNALIILRRIVTDRGGEICLCGLDSNVLVKSGLGGILPVARSRQEAIEKLLPVREKSAVARQNLATPSVHLPDGVVVSLVGCPERDLGDVPERLRSSRLETRLPGTVTDGDYVIFCISCTDGPTDGTRQAVVQCARRRIKPVAIVLTEYELIDNESLRDLVTAQEMELLCRILPRALVEGLPLYYDFDPGLGIKLLALIDRGVAIVTCA